MVSVHHIMKEKLLIYKQIVEIWTSKDGNSAPPSSRKIVELTLHTHFLAANFTGRTSCRKIRIYVDLSRSLLIQCNMWNPGHSWWQVDMCLFTPLLTWRPHQRSFLKARVQPDIFFFALFSLSMCSEIHQFANMDKIHENNTHQSYFRPNSQHVQYRNQSYLREIKSTFIRGTLMK